MGMDTVIPGPDEYIGLAQLEPTQQIIRRLTAQFRL